MPNWQIGHSHRCLVERFDAFVDWKIATQGHLYGPLGISEHGEEAIEM